MAVGDLLQQDPQLGLLFFAQGAEELRVPGPGVFCRPLPSGFGEPQQDPPPVGS